MKNAFLLKEDTKLQDVVKALDAGGIGFLAFINEDNILVGIVTDGDLRRGILKNELNVSQIINRNPETMSVQSTRREIIAKLKSLHRRHMPLVEKNNVLCSVFSLDDIEFVSRENYVVVMAGGLGSRLGELTKNIPKPMLKIGDRPMLQHLVEQFRDQGFSKFVFCLNYKKETIQEYFGNGNKFGVNINYIIEGSPLGTAGALGLLDKKGFDRPFFVVNADVLTSLDFGDFLSYHIEKKAMATMCVRQLQQQIQYGVISINDDSYINTIEEKPTRTYYVNAGIYVLDPKVLEYIPTNTFFDMPMLFELLKSNTQPCVAYKMLDYWVDIGRKEDLIRANHDLNVGFSSEDEDGGEIE